MISVIIPTYNRRNKIISSINSILYQSIRPDEIIVVDDGSTDGTVEMIKEKYGDLIKVISTGGRKGACVARNIGWDKCLGNIVAFQDSDDVWLPNKLEYQLRVLNETDSDAIFCSFIKNKDSTVSIQPKIIKNESNSNNYIKVDQLIARKAFIKNQLSTQTLLLKKDRVYERFDSSLLRFQDWDLYLSMLNNNRNLTFIPEPLVYVNEGHDSISKNFKNGISSRKKIFKKHFNSSHVNFIMKLRFAIGIYIREFIGVLWIK